jgi:hypothetical protein
VNSRTCREKPSKRPHLRRSGHAAPCYALPDPLSSSGPESTDPRRELVRRVAASEAFARSPQAKTFLLYVCEAALQEIPPSLTEPDLAAAVLEKARVDGHASAAVRAQASHVRRKLQQYFSAEGARETLILELPRGAYVPVFRLRSAGEQALPSATAAWPRAAPWLAVAAGLLCAAAWALRPPAPGPRPASSPRPSVERLWRQMFDNGRPTTLIVADATLTQLEDLIGEPIGLADYSRERLVARVQQRLTTREAWRLASRDIDRRHTTMADVGLAGRVLLLQSALGLSADVVCARDATADLFRSRNVILSGPTRANPWVELFEPRLNFETRFDTATRRASVVNRAPQSGEEPSYPAQWGVRGYCRVAYLPGRGGMGSVLLVSATDMTSTEAGADFVTSERSVRDLLARLEVAEGRPIPFFEVLLRATLVINSASSPELVAYRVVAP